MKNVNLSIRNYFSIFYLIILQILHKFNEFKNKHSSLFIKWISTTNKNTQFINKENNKIIAKKIFIILRPTLIRILLFEINNYESFFFLRTKKKNDRNNFQSMKTMRPWGLPRQTLDLFLVREEKSGAHPLRNLWAFWYKP